MNEWEASLKIGLVGRHRELYQTSPSFKAAVEALTNMLPFWVEGLALASSAADREHEVARRWLLSAPESLAALFPARECPEASSGFTAKAHDPHIWPVDNPQWSCSGLIVDD